MDYRICRSPVPAVPEAYQADQTRHGKLREAKGGKVSWASVRPQATSVFSSQVVSGCWQGKYEHIDIEAHSTLLKASLVCLEGTNLFAKTQNHRTGDICVPSTPSTGIHRPHTGSRCSIAIVAVAWTIPPHQFPTKNCANWPKQRQNGS